MDVPWKDIKGLRGFNQKCFSFHFELEGCPMKHVSRKTTLNLFVTFSRFPTFTYLILKTILTKFF